MAFITVEILTDFANKFAAKITEKFAKKTDIPGPYTHPTTAGNKHIPAGGASGQILRWSADGTAAWGNDNNTTYSDMNGATASTAGTHGLVPAPAAGTQGKYLRADGTWQTPTNTTYGNMTAATASAAGNGGLVPAPPKGAANRFLCCDATFKEIAEATTTDIDTIIAGTFQ